ncbi:MAG: DUF4065 domain-containing protein [Alphaproteobacteria bacterium]|nr:DUF4065 domain-containing protein [Alphaproteobacteria bacterium]
MSEISALPKTACSVSTAAAVANEFLALGHRDRDDPEIPQIDQLKLQKLLFYAHAWHLAIRKAPLFDEDFEAWPWGPVVRDIWNFTKGFKAGPITGKISRLTIQDGAARFTYPQIEAADLKDFIEAVWDAHKEFTGIDLSNSTHGSEEPWSKVKEAYGGNLDGKPTIPNDLIQEIFEKKLVHNAQANHSQT